MMEILRKQMIQGILDAGIVEDGGPQCHAQIPADYHFMTSLVSIIIHGVIIQKWNSSLTDKEQISHEKTESKNPNFIEKIVAFLGVISLVLTFYYKWITGKGAFILNPCHVTLVITIYLLISPVNSFTRKIHTCWTSWLYGAVMALLIPHLEGITQFQVFLYYFQHLLIIPVGPLVLYPRYGMVKPKIKNQMCAFATMVIYQLLVLAPVGRLTQVNLNFALCHSPADPSFEYIRHHYFPTAMIVLNIISAIARYIIYGFLLPLKQLYKSDNTKNVKTK